MQRVNKYPGLGAIVERPCIKLESVPKRWRSRPSLITMASPGSNQSTDYLTGGVKGKHAVAAIFMSVRFRTMAPGSVTPWSSFLRLKCCCGVGGAMA